jgi:hypothetical protein
MRTAVLPALTIGGALLAASGLTYAVVQHLPQQAAARSVAAGLPRTGPTQLAPPAGRTDPGWPRPRDSGTPIVVPTASPPSVTPVPGSQLPPGLGPVPTLPPGSGQPRSDPRPALTPDPSVRPGTGQQAPGRGTEQSELAGVAAVLERSAATRAVVLDAARGVVDCTLAPGQGLAELISAMAARQEELGLTQSLQVSVIPVGRQLRADLAAALRFSLAADRSLARWMKEARRAGDCPRAPLGSDAYRAALQASAPANEWKQKFLRLWDPLAARFGQPVYTGRQI